MTEPALTPGEWERKSLNNGEAAIADGDRLWVRELIEGIPPTQCRHALAALALHGQPFGFTWDDVEKLQEMPDGTGYASIDDPEWFASLIDRIAALLPPRG